MAIARLTIGVGILLTLLGAGFYFGLLLTQDKSPSVTALIPAFAGVPIAILGCIALKESARMHAMHVVAMLALLGVLLPLGRLGMKLAQGAEVKGTILLSLLLMAGLCGVLLAACIRSFIQARIKAAGND